MIPDDTSTLRPVRRRVAAIAYTGAMPEARPPAVEVDALKSDSFGRIALMRGPDGLFVRRDLVHVPAWLRLPAWWLARREARALRRVAGMEAVPQLLRWDGQLFEASGTSAVLPPLSTVTFGLGL